jgi:RNA polymerase sigma-70 factor (ECF subfamily)
VSEEGALIARAVDGEAEAWDVLVSRHRPTVLRTARHVLGDLEAAEDATQDVFVRVHSSLARFRGDADLGTWLYRVTLNVCRDRLRRLRRQPNEVDIERQAARPELSVEPRPDESVDRHRARDAVRQAVGRLPAEQRDAVLMRFMDDLPYDEIARISGVPPGTVASRVFRALERLGRDLEPRHLEVMK